MSLARVNFIGCGKLGKVIASLLWINNAALINGIVNTSLESSEKVIKLIGQGSAYNKIAELPAGDIYFITTCDDAIQSVCMELASTLPQGAIVIHCSGTLSSDILNVVKQYSCYVASIHPIKSFANTQDSIDSFTGTYCALEGEGNAIDVIKPLFEKIGGNVFHIDKHNKKLYHIAGVIGNNYLVTLHYYALQAYLAAGIDKTTAKNILAMLMTDTLKNTKKLDNEKLLTGPIQRGDIETIKTHMSFLNNQLMIKSIYSTLGLATLPITNHLEKKKEELSEALMTELPLIG